MYMYICIYVCVYIYKYIYVYTYICIYIYIYINEIRNTYTPEQLEKCDKNLRMVSK